MKNLPKNLVKLLVLIISMALFCSAAQAKFTGSLKSPTPSNAFKVTATKSGNQWWSNITLTFTNITPEAGQPH